MKTTLRHYGPVALLLAVILAATTCLSLLSGGGERADRPRVLVTNYPLYVAAQNILGDVDGVELTMLSGVGAGCLHDYQLTPADRLAIERAPVIVRNGVGDESLFAAIDEELLAGKSLNTSAGVELICSAHHHEEEHHHHTEYNQHVWVSPARYKQQVENLTEQLYGIVGRQEVTDNAAAYIAAIDGVAAELPDLAGRPCVLFHDSLSYLASDVGLEVKLTLTADGESGIAANHLAKVEQLAGEHPDLLLLYDTQYPIRYTAVDGLVPADQVISLETAVTGAGHPHDWLSAMERNAEKLNKLTGGDAP